MTKYITTIRPQEKDFLHILHVAETTLGGIDTYWSELTPMTGQNITIPLQNSKKRHKTTKSNILQLQQSFLAPKSSNQTIQTDTKHQYFTFPNHPRGPRKMLSLFLTLRHSLRTQPIDILFLHSSFAGFVGRLTLLTLPKPWPKVIYCAHGWSFNMAVPPWKKRLFLWLERRLTPLTTAIINVSKSEHLLALTYGIKKEKCILIHNAISKEVPPLTSQNLIFDPSKINILFIGRFHTAKGIDRVQKLAMSSLQNAPQIHFHIIGKATSKNDTTPNFNLKNTTCYGWINRVRVPSYIQKADAIIIPSRWEACSFTLLESLRQKKTVFTSNILTFKHLITQQKQGLILPIDDSQKSIQIIEKYSKSDLNTMGNNAYNLFIENYTSEKQHKKLIQLYESVFGCSCAV